MRMVVKLPKKALLSTKYPASSTILDMKKEYSIFGSVEVVGSGEGQKVRGLTEGGGRGRIDRE